MTSSQSPKSRKISFGLVSGVALMVGLLPGMPFLPFALMAAGAGSLAWMNRDIVERKAQEEAEAKAEYGGAVEVVRFDYAHNDRAIAGRKKAGFIKVMVVKGRPVGASIVGHQAGEIANLWSLVLANGLKMSQISSMVSPYPTYGELSKRAAGAYFSPRLFENPRVKKMVRLVQRLLP